tara:strand:- start:560 stop:1423 length:864 start_codon:yes stop_codon:yes gene_type:complete
MKKRFSFWIQTNSRVQQTLTLMSQLNKFSDYGDIYLSDSGGRTKDFFIRKSKEFNLSIHAFDYIDNSKYFNDPYEHYWSIMNNSEENMFFFHDDDQINYENFLKVLELITKNDEINFLCTTNNGKSKYLNDFKAKNIQQKINNIIKLYFLSHDDNCLLLTGLFIKKPKTLRADAGSFIVSGMYADVPAMCYMFSRKNSFITPIQYIYHLEHDNNHNKTRSIEDREILSKFILDQPGIFNLIISKLIFHGYPKKIFTFIQGLTISIFYPPIWNALILKIFSKFKNSLN